ncbi:MAG: hypothetical protein BGP10_12325 [Rhodanobacter sp. 68-29]|nr:MAG: hypothetical protein ABT19_00245 [Rhodanobacter sp. SCN 68-63]OJY60677.1 MAG: hypothetical protein BGP10_12325 [Rhodanobacter sp. 68-29]
MRACTDCRFHHLERGASLIGRGIHLCTLYYACKHDPEDERERDERGGEFLGWDCDAARRMGELCGPAGKRWAPADSVTEHPR